MNRCEPLSGVLCHSRVVIWRWCALEPSREVARNEVL